MPFEIKKQNEDQIYTIVLLYQSMNNVVVHLQNQQSRVDNNSNI